MNIKNYVLAPLLFLTIHTFAQVEFERCELTGLFTASSNLIFEDFDLDGDQDLIVGLRFPDRLSYFENLGNGNFDFKNEVFLASGNRFYELYSGDFDLDGNIDVAYRTLPPSVFEPELVGTLVILFNLGGASFSDSIPLANVPETIREAKLGDCNGDGYLDFLILTASSSGWVINVEGETQYVDLGMYGTDILTEDVDLNGRSDAFVFDYFNEEASTTYFLSEVDGTFTEMFGPFTLYPTQPLLADLNNDGFLDLFSLYENEAYIYYNNGDNIFSEDYVTATLDGNSFAPLGLLYLNDDDAPTFVYETGNDLISLFSFENGVFEETAILEGQFDNNHPIALADLNEDGFDDILVRAGSQAEDILIYRDFIPNTYRVDEYLGIGTSLPLDMRLADMNGDGLLDIIVTGFNTDLAVLLANSNGGYTPWEYTFSNFLLGECIEAVDANEDGFLDVLVGGVGGIGFGLNDGTGHFDLIEEISNLEVTEFDRGDMNNDGFVDVLGVNDEGLFLLQNNGNGSFEDPVYLLDASAYHQLSVLDFDSDGNQDFFALDALLGIFYLHIGSGDGLTYDMDYVSLPFVEGAISDVHPSDFDGDGDIDLIAARTGGRLLLYEQNEFGEFDQTQSGEYAYPYFFELELGDADGDGDEDVFLSHNGDEESVLYIENDGAQFGDLTELNQDQFHSSVRVADLDSDGKAEMVCTSFQEAKVVLYAITEGEGCMDSSACNYDPEATFETGNCCFSDCGCTNPLAINYDELAACDNGSCMYNVSGYVYFDANGNGAGEIEEAMPNQQVFLAEVNQTMLTDDNGFFSIALNYEGEINLEILNASNFDFFGTNYPLNFVLGEQPVPEYEILLASEKPNLDVSAYLYWSDFFFFCDAPVRHTLAISNNSNFVLSGNAYVVLDELLNGYEELTEISEVIEDSLFFSFPPLMPGEVYPIKFMAITPSVDFIGEEITLDAGVGIGEDDPTEFTSMTETIVCAYDPNDKRAFPSGWTDENYVSANESLLYKVRFQNTGSAPATDVQLVDQISENFDLSTVMMIDASHNYELLIDNELRTLTWDFKNINLPDSTSNEPESHGFVAFSIDYVDEAPLESVVENTVEIYFDSNSPIITNTTFNTTYDCSLFQPELTISQGILSVDEGEVIQWYLDDLPISVEGSSLQITESGSYSADVANGFPCVGTTPAEFIQSVERFSMGRYGFTVQPNPASESVFIKIAGDANSKIVFFDALGRVIELESRPTNGQDMMIDIADLPAGLYFISLLQNGQAIQTEKLIVE